MMASMEVYKPGPRKNRPKAKMKLPVRPAEKNVQQMTTYMLNNVCADFQGPFHSAPLFILQKLRLQNRKPKNWSSAKEWMGSRRREGEDPRSRKRQT
jgi:hypothetical protein